MSFADLAKNAAKTMAGDEVRKRMSRGGSGQQGQGQQAQGQGGMSADGMLDSVTSSGPGMIVRDGIEAGWDLAKTRTDGMVNSAKWMAIGAAVLGTVACVAAIALTGGAAIPIAAAVVGVGVGAAGGAGVAFAENKVEQAKAVGRHADKAVGLAAEAATGFSTGGKAYEAGKGAANSVGIRSDPSTRISLSGNNQQFENTGVGQEAKGIGSQILQFSRSSGMEPNVVSLSNGTLALPGGGGGRTQQQAQAVGAGGGRR